MKDTSVVFRDFDKLIVKILGNSFFGFRPVNIQTHRTQIYESLNLIEPSILLVCQYPCDFASSNA